MKSKTMDNDSLLYKIATINLPIGSYFAAITFGDIHDIAAISLSVVSIICTILITRSQLKRNASAKEEE